jgi:serine/threonine protein kinase
MDDSGGIRIADFGFSTVTQNLESVENSVDAPGYTLHWTAPETLNGKMPSQNGDIFSFAMVMIEVRHGRSTIGKALP